ncbi:MAG: tRNA uridine-5-carboxymethylaminomethyl(34) synthesis GTPase MnmE [Chlamydiota bacterium]
MQHTHRAYIPGETIAAVATAPGEGGIAVIRISGKEAIALAAEVFTGSLLTCPTHTVRYGKIIDAEGKCIDHAIALVMRAPKSYTGEDTVEIHCHGGSLITQRVLDTILKAGARAAGPGEFTLRAFLSGKIDLAQAEAVQQLIGAKNQLALHSAEKQLEGRLSKKILQFQEALVDTAAILEAWVDFPEEDLEFASMNEVVDHLRKIQGQMQDLLATFQEGKIIHHGISLCLAGPPNAGKSSLMNALLGKDRAIVTAIAGTTRDLLEEDLRLGDLHFRIIDTAGIRETEEVIEQEGIRRTKDAMQQADLILLVLDSTQPLCAEAGDLLASSPPHKTLVVWNKMDLLSDVASDKLHISAKTGDGIEALKNAIHQLIWKKGPPSKEEIVITSARHYQSLGQAISALEALIDGLLTGISPEFVSLEMRKVLSELGTIVGADVTEDILSAIFSKFCIGK